MQGQLKQRRQPRQRPGAEKEVNVAPVSYILAVQSYRSIKGKLALRKTKESASSCTAWLFSL